MSSWLRSTLAFLVLATSAIAQDRLEISRLRVPSDGVKTIFPAGTDLRGMSLDEFEALVAAATKNAAKRASPAAPILLRARHQAKWQDGVLTGSSEWTLQATAETSAAVSLEPWTPAILTASDAIRALRHQPLALASPGLGVRAVTLGWEQISRPGTQGKSFDLGLSSSAACRLTLDLPDGLMPEVSGAIRQGPAPGSAADRRSWRLEGPGGLWRLNLRATSAPDRVALAWISGVTRIDLSEMPMRWNLDATVDPGMGGSRRFSLVLDPGLDPIDVIGPGIASYRVAPLPDGAGTVLFVRLSEAVTGPTAFTVRALGRPPSEGAWTIPAYRPRDLTWTGGRTLVKLGAGQAVSSVRATSGRQSTPTAAEREFGAARPGLLLAFESFAPGSPAEIVTDRSPLDATAEVRGQVALGPGEAPRITAKIAWKVDRGRLATLAADLPPGWSPERVQIGGVTDPTAWHAEARPGGGTRLVVHPPPVAGSGGVTTLEITALGRALDAAALLELPRILPVGGRVVDDVWQVNSEPGLIVSPRQARGLSWLDPATLQASKPASSSRPVLAWRWTAGDGRGTLAVAQAPARSQVEVWTSATIRPDRWTLDYYLAIDLRGRPLSELAIAFVGETGEIPIRWDMVGEPRRDIEAAPIVAAEREILGLPAQAPAARIALPRGGRDRIILHARSERMGSGSGPIPLVVLGHRNLERGTLLIGVDRSLAADVEAANLANRDPSWASSTLRSALGVKDDAVTTRPILAYGYGPDSSAPTLRVRPLPAASLGGVVEEARLTSTPSKTGQTLHRLALRVRPGPDRLLEITLPEAATPQRVEIEGRDASPVRLGATLRVLLPVATATRSTIDVEMDYLAKTGERDGELQPIRPRLSLPCLAFSWELELTPGSEIADVRGNLMAIEMGEHPPLREMGNLAAIGEFEQRVQTYRPDGLTLAGWLKRLDGGKTPIVVDRLSLDRAGWGPRTPLANARGRSAIAVFAEQGLSLTFRNGCALVTVGDDHDIDVKGILQAAETGHDRVDRLQSVARWRGEPTPGLGRERPANLSEITSTVSRDFIAVGLPEKAAGVRLQDTARRPWFAVVCVAILAVSAFGVRKIAFAWQGVALAASLTFGVISAQNGGGMIRDMAAPVLVGACIAAGMWLGRALWPHSPGHRAVVTSSRLVGTGAATLFILGSMLAQAPGHQSASAPVPESAIVVLLPYDPPFDPSIPPTRVILRLGDYERLRSWAAARPEGAGLEPFLIAATHEVRRESPLDARVASAFDLRCEEAASTWSFPVESARDLSATLDGRDVPVRIAPGATNAGVEIAGKGPHRLIVRRLFALNVTHEGESLHVAIPPIATARVRVDDPPDGPTLEAPAAVGRVARQGRVAEIALGPLSTLDLRWTNRSASASKIPNGRAEAVFLWDIRPAGDRVLARFTPRATTGLNRLILSLEPGVIVRSIERAGGTPISIERLAPDGNTWGVSLEPPLLLGQSLALELWRPLTGDPDAKDRRLPRVELAGLAEFSGLIGARRPTEWVGRIVGSEVVPDDLFARAWGAFPDATMTFAGASRFVAKPELSLEVGPSREKPRVVPSVLVELAPGRLEIRAEADLSDDGGRLRELSAAIPADLRINRVEAVGLTDWSRPSDDRLRLRFDGENTAARRTIRVTGWVPTDGDPMATKALQAEAEMPWPGWLGVDSLAGSLTIVSPPNVTIDKFEPRPGIRPAIPIFPGVARSAFAVAPGARPGKLTWTAEATGVSVRVQNLVTLYPDSAEWIASALYTIPAGPCPQIKLRLPAEWASAATLEVDGISVRPEAATADGKTTWTVPAEKPFWGNSQVIVRAVRPRKSGVTLDCPDLIPLGRRSMDRAESYVAYVDATGTQMIVEGSAELQEVDASKWNGDEIAWTPGPRRHVFRVRKEGWSLKFLGATATTPVAQGAGVTFADLEGTLDANGVFFGRASYHLDGRSATSLLIDLPDGTEPITSTVDGQIVVPRRDDRGQIVIPLPERAEIVVFAWKGAVRARDSRLPLPSLPGQFVPILWSVSAPDGSTFSTAGSIAPIAPNSRERLRAEYQSRELIARLETFERGSPRDRADLLAGLIRFELDARSAGRTDSLREALRPIRNALDEALAAQGLEDFGRSAIARVGGGTADPLPEQPAISEAPEPLRIRPLGESFRFHDRSEQGNSEVFWNSPKPQTRRFSAEMVAMACGLLPLVLIRTGRRWPRIANAGFASIAMLAAMVWLPLVWPIAALASGVAVGLFARE